MKPSVWQSPVLPSKSAIHDCAIGVRRAAYQARDARNRLRLSVRECAVSPPVLLGGVLTGFAAGRILGAPHAQGSGVHRLKNLGAFLSLLRFV